MENKKVKGGLAIAGAAIIALVYGVIDTEGGYVNHPSDPGGETNHGITKRVAQANGYTASMKALPKDMAADIYYSQYVVKPGFLAIAQADIKLGEEVIDSGVNAGPSRAGKWFQTCLNYFNRRGRDYRDVAVDGKVGAGTMGAYHELRNKRGSALAQDLMLKCTDGLQFGHYARLADGGSKFEDFMIGWTRTRIGNVK